MRAFLFTLSLAFAAVALPAHAFAAGAPIPPAPARFMTDTVGFVSPGAAAAIDARLEAYQKATGHQVVVWIGDSLNGDDLADWSVRTFAAWKPGRKGVDDGVAMFVLASDRKIDIEVGYGLEGDLTDAKARRVIDGMTTMLQAGDKDGALASGVESIFAAIDGQPFPGATSGQAFSDARDPRQRPPLGLAQKIFFGIVALGFVILFITNPRMAMLLLWSIMGRGGGGGFGGGGGGGFDGGGGRSGGGGAPGRLVMALGWLSRGGFARRVDADKVKAAIQAAERQTSGEIVVSVSRWFYGSVQKAAEMTFARLGVQKTAERNGVLVFVVPARRQFVLLGDAGIHAKVGQSFWDGAAEAISHRFREGDVTGALVEGIERIGAQLATHFPHQGERDVNELPDELDFGRGGRGRTT